MGPDIRKLDHRPAVVRHKAERERARACLQSCADGAKSIVGQMGWVCLFFLIRFSCTFSMSCCVLTTDLVI